MPVALILLAALAGAGSPGTVDGAVADCDANAGWNEGRSGRSPRLDCRTDAYAEAHRLGEALHALQTEHAAIETELGSLDATARNAKRRRQRQIETDLEALRGIATIRGWPLQPVSEPLL